MATRFCPYANPSNNVARPIVGKMCINVDGAVSFHNCASVVGILVRDHLGFVSQCPTIQLGFLSPSITELVAIYTGVDLFRDNNWSDASIESNSQFAVNICNSTSLWTGKQQALVHCTVLKVL